MHTIPQERLEYCLTSNSILKRTPSVKGTIKKVKEPTVLAEIDIEHGDRSLQKKSSKIKLPIHGIIRTMTLPQPIAAKKLGVSISTL